MSDFKTVLIEDSRIADITASEVFGVQSGASQSTYQQFQAVSTSNSSIVFNVQVPSENIVIDRHLLLSSKLSFQLKVGSATNPVFQVPIGQACFQYGLSDSLQAFPLNSLFTTIQSTINNVSVSTNLQDVLPMLMRMNDKRMLSRYNSMTPSLPDSVFGEYKNGAVGANNNPMGGYTNASYDEDFEGRGAFHLDSLQIDHYIAGVYTDSSPVSTAVTDTWIISISVTLTEPFLALSPFINCEPNCSAGLVGINNMSMVLNVDSTCKRLFSTSKNTAVPALAPTALSGFIETISLGFPTAPNLGVSVPIGFANTRLLFNFLSLQPEQYAKISTKNVVPFLDYPRYLTTSSSTVPILPNTTQTITSQSIQLNQIPDLILITARVPMATQNQNYASAFLAIKKISVNFNNASGLLSTATQQDLYNISYRNGSSQSFYEFRGRADIPKTTGAATTQGGVVTLATTGSLLVLSPVMDFSLPSYLSASSLGQYQFQFNIDVDNQFDYSILPELCIITVNSGVFATQQGTSQIFTGILTKEQVLRTKEQNPVPHLASGEYARLVGGKLMNRGMGAVASFVKENPKLVSAVADMARRQLGAMGGQHSGGQHSGGAMCGGAISGGAKSQSKLARHLA